MPLKFIRSTLAAWCLFTALTTATAFAAVDVQVRPGFNVLGVSQPVQALYVSAFPLLDAWKAAGITAIESYDHSANVLLRAELSAGNPTGIDFPLVENSALFVYSGSSTVVNLGDVAECSALSLKTGFNLTSVFCPPAGYRASDLVNSLGIASILSVAKFDGPSARWITAAVNGTTVVGEDFLIVPGEGYIIYAAADVANWISPRQTFTFSPSALTVHQEEAGLSLNLTIPAIASAGGVTVNLVSSNTSTLTVPALVTIPAGTTSVSVPVTALATGSPVSRVVQVTASKPNWTSGTATVTVLPKPTVNLTPTTTLTGKGWTYFLTATLTEAAPAGGIVVTLTTSTTNVVDCPATVTVDEGALSSQVTVTAVNPGIATITASAPLLLSGSTHTVTVNPVQTIDIGPVLGAPVGVMVGSVVSQTTATMVYSPVVSVPVGVSVGSVITGLSPDRGSIGTTDMLLHISGAGLASVNTVTFNPSNGIAVLSGPVPAGDGSSVDVHIAIDETATISQRTIIVSSPSGTVKPAVPGANSFQVTYKPPELWSLVPMSQNTGSTFTLQVSGRNLHSASAVEFIPPDGISVGNPPTVSTDGTLVSVSVAISAGTATGYRAVTITTPGGTTPTALSAGNTFEVRSSVPPAGYAYNGYTPVVSPQVGVLVGQPVSQTTATMSYTPVTSQAVGVSVGSVITGLSPDRSAIGTADLLLRINGSGLASVNTVTFIPSNGITVLSVPAPAGDGSYADVHISIDEAATISKRTIIVSSPSGAIKPAVPGANSFRVTYKPPELWSLVPTSQVTGTTFMLQVNGRNLQSASAIEFIPPDGISVANPPTVSSDGTLASVSVAVSAGTMTGFRAVAITTPGGTTTSALSSANTFEVRSAVPPAGYAYYGYTPVVSSQVGVMVTQPSTTSSYLATYLPTSAAVGIMVVTAPSPTTKSVSYAPVLSLPVGITVGSVVTGISPASIEPGATTDITIHGIGLSSMTTVTVQPPAGITVGAPVPAGDGLSAVVSVTTTTSVAVGTKTIIVSSASGTIPPASPGANRLRVGPAPVIQSIVPNIYAAGNAFTLTINGLNLQNATEVRFIPATDIEVGNPPTVSPDGKTATVTVVIAFAAAGGDRVVTVTTPFGTTSSAALAGNTFTVVPQFGWNDPVQVEEGPVFAGRTSDPVVPEKRTRDFDPGFAVVFMTGARSGDEKQNGPWTAWTVVPHGRDGTSFARWDLLSRRERAIHGRSPDYCGPPGHGGMHYS